MMEDLELPITEDLLKRLEVKKRTSTRNPGIVLTELLVIKSGVPLGKKSYSDEEIEREILVLVVAERAHAMGIFC